MKCECTIGLLVIQFMLCKADELDLLFAENKNYVDNANYEDFEFDFEDYDYDFLNVRKSTCKHPGKIKHGKVEIWGDDLLIDYSCDDGFIPHGITHGACDVKNKVWTIDPVVCVSSDCNFLLPPKKGIVSMDKIQGVASITCEQGLHLIGSPVLYCQEGKWVGGLPVCVRSSELENHSGLNVTEEERFHKKFVDQSDESCFHYHIEPPKILYSLVLTSYIMNTKRKRYVMVARYSCVNGYRLLNGNAAYLYCKNSKWTAEIMPKCILDNDPCEIDNGGCDHNCVFYSKTNKYVCTCKPGYTLGSDKKQCVDIDECLVQNAGCQQLCINTQGAYTCSCNRGFITNGTQCTDIDECETSKNVCPGPCINRPGSFKCDCKIKGYRSSRKPYFCQDLDECKRKNGKCDDVCENTRGSYRCRCETRGWKLHTDNHTCVDVNECQRYNGKVCLHGDCINSIGSYRCICNPGFTPAERDRFCLDLNECEVDNGGCEDECINTDGSYYCNCSRPGYTGASNGFHCIDIDECTNGNGGCQGSCTNIPGSFKCSCPNVGEVLAEDGLSCNACRDDEVYNTRDKKCVKCPEHAQTKPNVLMPLSEEDCVCKEGFVGEPSLLVPCLDIDECASGLITCQYQCVNTIGSAHCICPKGFMWLDAKKVCRDLNECQENNGGCSQNCKNIQGSYRCSCDNGYTLDSDKHSCNDIDECLLPKTKCPHKCLNLNGSYTCTCEEGYHYNERADKCEDINECESEAPPCNQSCTNIPGSYMCNCDGPGFKLSWDNTACIDINECMEGHNPCGESCQNTIGSFKCECNKNGYTATENGLKCRDINECELNDTKVCEQLCINLPGTYRCSCHPGYRRSGSQCIACPVGFFRGVRDKDCRRCPQYSITGEIGATSKVECICRDGYKGDPSRDLKCQDIDECAVNNNDCSHRCVNTAGSAYCTCRPGFQLDIDRKSCIDVDECKTSNGGCEQMCFNTLGSFLCTCEPQFELASNNRSCKDVNECLYENHRCEHRCVNIRGGYRCGCHNGYKLTTDNKTCEDINECETDNGRCTDKCFNSVGSYECKCTIPGYQLYGDGKQCVDIDECEDETLCEDQCENTYGSYKCLCNGNVNLSEDAHTCDDFDECADNSTHACDQICINLRGTYRCDCFPGYYKSGLKCRLCPKNSYRDATMPVTTCLRCPKRADTPGPGGSSISDCKCTQGYEITSPESKECTDINECGEAFLNMSLCEQKCNNLPGSYFCSCARGQRLLADRKSCDAKVNCQPLKRQRKTLVWPPDCVTPGRRRLTPGFMCSTRCYQGYIMTGSRLRTCLNKGQFSGTEPKCSLARCKGLRKIPNGKLYPPRCRASSVPFGVRCRVKCARGFVLKGRVGTKCRATQKWSHRLRTRCVPLSSENATT